MPQAKQTKPAGKAAATPKQKKSAAEPTPQPEHLPAPQRRRWLLGVSVIGVVVVLVGVLMAGFMLLYAGKVYPGVRVDGAYLGGLDRAKAAETLAATTQAYGAQSIPIVYGNSTFSLGVGQIGTTYNVDRSVAEAYAHGRSGGWANELRQVARALVGRQTKLSDLSYDDTKLTPYLDQIDQSVTTPVSNAGLQFSGASVTVAPSKVGQRLDTGQLVRLIEQRLASGSSAAIVAPVYQIAPVVDDQGLNAAKSQASGYLTGPITLQLPSKSVTIAPSDITGWITVNRASDSSGLEANLTLNDFSYAPKAAPIKLSLDAGAIAAYVANLAKTVDQTGQNAELTIVGGAATVFKPSRTGYQMDQTGTVTAIQAALTKPASDRVVAVSVKTIEPDITEASLNNLGINQLLSEGVTYFPGSPAARMQNIRVGASKFNGVLIKPGDTFSFESLLGDVDAAAGYAPALVILGNKEVYQYGGGMCQVSSTAFRAALLAGLPIVERHNHSFAVGYYTAPFGVPGVDATVFNLSVDLKFRNDTGHYILIQTILSGTTLKFDFYGTKTKSGQIRGPYFSDPAGGAGWNATVPSTTYFYRDVLDLNGNVTKTDTFTEHYASSLDFPVIPQFN